MATACATNTAKVDDPDRLVMEIMEVQMEMDRKGIDCYRVISDHIIKSLPSSTRESGRGCTKAVIASRIAMTKLRASEAHSITAGAIGAHSTPAQSPASISALPLHETAARYTLQDCQAAIAK